MLLAGCKNANSGEEEVSSGRFGASDAQVARDTDFKQRECYCTFLLDSSERDPYRFTRTTGKSKACEFYSGEDGRGENKLDTLIVEAYSGASKAQYNAKLAKLGEGYTSLFDDKAETGTKGSQKDIHFAVRLGRIEGRRIEKRMAYFNDFNGHMFVVTEKSLEVTENTDLDDIFDELEERYLDALDLNFQGACQTDIDL